MTKAEKYPSYLLEFGCFSAFFIFRASFRKGACTLYRIVGRDSHQIVLEFRKDNKELVFQEYAEAEQYLKRIKQANIIPQQYKLEIRSKRG
ncbi:hypothetical protein [Halobacillus karajensis]|uniref:hypothetical protein n=1 Tax=Halobacillus karajensis TaxID=195088 RepID=UPI001E3B9585|nr:hypothetical protein [Halobacillus karajensis]